jgi:mycothiol synthase
MTTVPQPVKPAPASAPTIDFRSAGEADYPVIVALENAHRPDDTFSADTMRFHDQARPPGKFLRRELIVAGGEIVGHLLCSESNWSSTKNLFHVRVVVRPDRRGEGIGRAGFARAVESAREAGAAKLDAWTRSTDERSVRFLTDRGFRLREREVISILQLPLLDIDRFAGVEARARNAGVVITTFPELLPHRSRLVEELYELDKRTTEDIPLDEPVEFQGGFETWRRHVLDHPRLLLDAWFIALAPDGTIVGFSNASLGDTPAELDTGYTCVTREWRGKGIAFSLKLAVARFAIARGAVRIGTSNPVANRPMLRINEAMGFYKLPEDHTYRVDLNTSAEAPAEFRLPE